MFFEHYFTEEENKRPHLLDPHVRDYSDMDFLFLDGGGQDINSSRKAPLAFLDLYFQLISLLWDNCKMSFKVFPSCRGLL